MQQSITLERIWRLIETGDWNNIQLGFQLAKSQGISKAKVLEPWEEVLEYVLRINPTINIDKSDHEVCLFNLLNIKRISLLYDDIDVTYLPDSIDRLVNLEAISFLENKLDYIPDAVGNLKIKDLIFRRNRN